MRFVWVEMQEWALRTDGGGRREPGMRVSRNKLYCCRLALHNFVAVLFLLPMAELIDGSTCA